MILESGYAGLLGTVVLFIFYISCWDFRKKGKEHNIFCFLLLDMAAVFLLSGVVGFLQKGASGERLFVLQRLLLIAADVLLAGSIFLALLYAVICIRKQIKSIGKRELIFGILGILLMFSSFVLKIVLEKNLLLSSLVKDNETAPAAVQGLLIWLTFYLLAAVLLYTAENLICRKNKVEKELEIVQDKEAQRKELSRILIGQLRPHFLFNCISSAMLLCRKDPAKASDCLLDFADYLRVNLQTIEAEQVRPFTEELRHMECYTRLEKLRFKEKLKIEFEIFDQDFQVPVLSVQPLVENAIKHGVMQKKEGGTVTIRAFSTDYGHQVEIIDDGVGFSEETAYPEDGKNREGLRAVRRRLDLCPGAELKIESEPASGTKVTLRFP